MALLAAVFGFKIKAQIGFMKLDISMNENHSRLARVTENEIEDGSIVSDHVKLDPRTVSISGIVSNTPISILGLGVSVNDVLGAANDFLTDPGNAYDGIVKNSNRSPQDAWQYLQTLQEQRIPFSIITTLQRYENMIMTSLSAPRTADVGDDLHFTAELRQIEIVESAVTTVPAFKTEEGQTRNSASSKSGLGKQATKEASDAQADNSSLLLQGFKKVGIFQ